MVSSKEVVAAGKGLAYEGWTCPKVDCKATGNYPKRRECRKCSGPPPTAWTTAQQRATAAKKAIVGGQSVHYPWTNSARVAQSTTWPKPGHGMDAKDKEIAELRQKLAQQEAFQKKQGDETEDDEQESELGKKVRRYESALQSLLPDEVGALAIRELLDETRKQWHSTWPPERRQLKSERRLADFKEKLEKAKDKEIAELRQKLAQKEDLQKQQNCARLRKETAEAFATKAEAEKRLFDEAADRKPRARARQKQARGR